MCPMTCMDGKSIEQVVITNSCLYSPIHLFSTEFVLLMTCTGHHIAEQIITLALVLRTTICTGLRTMSRGTLFLIPPLS